MLRDFLQNDLTCGIPLDDFPSMMESIDRLEDEVLSLVSVGVEAARADMVTGE